jgi:hypothetical protein
MTSTYQTIVSTTLSLPFAGRLHIAGDVDVGKDTTTNSTTAAITCDAYVGGAQVGEPMREDIGTPTHHRQISVVASVARGAGTYTVQVRCRGNNAAADRANLSVWATADTSV